MFKWFDKYSRHLYLERVAKATVINRDPNVYACFFFSEEAESLAKKLRLKFYRTSVKEDLNVNDGELKTGMIVY